MNPLEAATIKDLIAELQRRARTVVVLLGGVHTEDVNETWSGYKNGLHAEAIGMLRSFEFDMLVECNERLSGREDDE